MVNVQYDREHALNEHWLRREARHERAWIRSADGICFRSPYLDALNDMGIRPAEGAPTILLPEPVLSATYNAAPLPPVEEGKPLNVFLDDYLLQNRRQLTPSRLIERHFRTGADTQVN